MRMKIIRGILSILFMLIMVGGAFAFDMTDPVATTIPANMRYQSYVTLSGYTSVTIPFKSDLGRAVYLGYVRNVGAQQIEVFPNYAEDTGSTMNAIPVGGGGVVWDFSPANLQIDTMKIRSTTAADLNIEVVVH
jgi:hypothetical protein